VSTAPGTAGPATAAEAIALIEAAAWPRDLFGPDAVRCYRRLARLTHPDAGPGDASAAAAFAKLAALWQRYRDDGGQTLAPAPVAALARGCMLASPRGRPQDAWQLLGELDDLLGRLYGPRKFRPFAIPA
jgi:hypothetical protein